MDRPKRIGHEVKTLSNLIKRYLQDRLDKSGLGGVTGIQGMIIGYLYKNASDREIFQRDIEQEFDIRRSTVTGILQLMEENGLVIREPVSYDARLKRLRLTPKAELIHKTIIRELDRLEDKLKTGLSQREVEMFFDIVDRMKQNVG